MPGAWKPGVKNYIQIRQNWVHGKKKLFGGFGRFWEDGVESRCAPGANPSLDGRLRGKKEVRLVTIRKSHWEVAYGEFKNIGNAVGSLNLRKS